MLISITERKITFDCCSVKWGAGNVFDVCVLMVAYALIFLAS